MTDIVVITGATAGVGRATALRFARDKATVALLARDESRLAAAAQDVRAAGGNPLTFSVDVADAAAVQRACDQVIAAVGRIDIWINNAMATVFSPVAKLTPEEIRRATDVTYLGAVHGTLAALNAMRPRNRGVIVQVGSALAYRSIPLQAPYCGAKHAIVGFTDSLRSELIHDRSGIQVSIVHLPAINTPQFDWARNKTGTRPQPVPPIFQPEVAANAIHYAALHPRREFWLGWPTAEAIVGEKLAPGLLDRYLAGRGYDGQLTDEPVTGSGEGNLFTPVPGAFGAHGRFDDKARARSSEFWFSKHKRELVGAGLALGALALLTTFRR